MPVYTYRCTNCGFVFDQHQKFSDSPLTKCPECQKKSLQKVFQPVGIVFKGSGFYSTDHRSPSGMGRTSPKPSETGERTPPPLEKPAENSTKSSSSDSE
jgi:putative FmdB family regulatory protein